ncbi:hypothetical protein Airi01_090300 [Actinoallomurus iriomotensis]|uniref:Uncharacterized protein n=1 Tax=Actinoallomurus iriomotensis TaxID=478107 RepID=A0A9W6RS42_9ACTN|nr:hypothetical protein Airi01_090300 [Actinoallomurus iriomotensis]
MRYPDTHTEEARGVRRGRRYAASLAINGAVPLPVYLLRRPDSPVTSTPWRSRCPFPSPVRSSGSRDVAGRTPSASSLWARAASR